MRSRPLLLWRSVRVRSVVVVLVLIAATLGVSILASRSFLLQRVDDRIERRLTAEVQELRVLARTGVDPSTGKPFADARSLMRLALERAAPDRYETMFSIVDGVADARSTKAPAVRLDADTELVRRLATVTATTRGSVRTGAGVVQYVAVPVSVAGSQGPRGVFVVAWFRDLEAGEVRSAVAIFAGVGGVAALVAAVLAWLLMGRLLRPLRSLGATARRVGEHDLEARANVTGRDEVADIGRAFNGMLDRLELAFAEQRRFADDAGHELRTPITIVRGHLELLSADAELRSEQRALMLDELDRMSRMVDELLILSRSEHADFIVASPVDLDVLAAELEAKARALGERRWHVEGAPTGVVRLDRQRVTQAVLQLVQNAVQHTSPTDAIGVSIMHIDHRLVVTVSDDGPGIAPEERHAVFERFARGRGTARVGPGAGLGLAIVRAIAQAHGGDVRAVDPVEGTGARVVLTIATTPDDLP